MQQDKIQRKSLIERIIHAVSFELLATLILSPAVAWIMNRSVFEIGGLNILLATAAMIWNVIYNSIFDRLWPVSRVSRNLRVRILHAIGFEVGFIMIGVTIAAVTLGISLWQAFVLEIGFILFFFPYTMVFNWLWDIARERVQKHC